MTEEEIKKLEEKAKKAEELEKKQAEMSQKLEKLTKDSETYKQFSDNVINNLKEIGYNEDEEIDKFIERKKAEAEKNKNNTSKGKEGDVGTEELEELRSEFKTIKSKYEELNKSHETLKAEKEKADRESKQQKLRSKLLDSMKHDDGSYAYAGAEARVENLILKGVVDIDKTGEPIWRDEKDPEIKKDFSEGLKNYLERDDIKRDYRDPQKGGSGSRGSKEENNKPDNMLERRKELRRGGRIV